MKILTLDEFEADADAIGEWNISSSLVGEPYYQLTYLKAAVLQDPGELLLIMLKGEEGSIIYATIKREIKSTRGEGLADLTTPYEYGGPVCVGKIDTNEVKQFTDSFHDYCLQNNIISEFLRFNPMLQNQNQFGDYYSIEKTCDNVYLDLTQGMDSIFQGFRPNRRRDIMRAIKNEVHVKLYEIDRDVMARFLAIYHKRMKALGAKEYYYFSEAYFERLSQISGFVKCGIATYKGEDIAANLFLFGKTGVHYHLGGISEIGQSLGASSLLMFEGIKKAAYEERQWFHLGGASASQKSLYAFKRRFSHLTKEYYIGKKIHHKKKYDELAHQYKIEDSSFFPAYRDPRLMT